MAHEVMNRRPGTIEIEVAYAACGTPTAQRIIAMRVAPGTSAWEALRQSGIAAQFPEIDLDTAAIGIFSRKLDGKRAPAPKDYTLKDRDRIEIYRPLRITPKQARKLRAGKKRAE